MRSTLQGAHLPRSTQLNGLPPPWHRYTPPTPFFYGAPSRNGCMVNGHTPATSKYMRAPPVPSPPLPSTTSHNKTKRRSPIRRPARATMEWSRVTHDKRRLRLWETLRGRVGCVLQRGPSFAWLSAAVGASKRVRRQLGGLAVSEPRMPTTRPKLCPLFVSFLYVFLSPCETRNFFLLDVVKVSGLCTSSRPTMHSRLT